MAVDFILFSNVSLHTANFIDHKRTDIDVINKPWRALGPSKVAHSLRSNGYTVQIINFSTYLTEEQLYEISKPFMDYKTLIGVSTTFLADYLNFDPSIIPLCKAVGRLKSEFNTKVIVGGPTAVAYQKLFNADFVVNGAAENSILDLFDKIKNYGIRKPRTDWTIKTCAHRWDPSDRIQPNETLPLEVGRGCIYSCKFCKYDMKGKKRGEYVRDLSLIRDEIVENYERYHVSNYMIMDDTFNDDVYKMEDWCRMVDDLPFKIQYNAYCRADLIYRYQDMTRELYRTGMVGSVLGIESMNPKAAGIIGKSWSGKHAKDFIPYYVHDICKGKTLTQVNFIIGLPGDTIEDAWSWVKWGEDNKIPGIQMHPLSIRVPRFHPNDAVYSDFDMYAEEKYGYKFPHEKYPALWVNDKMSMSRVLKIYPEFMNYISERFSENSWAGFASLSLGYTVEEIINTPFKQLYKSERYIEQTNSWFDNYVKSF